MLVNPKPYLARARREGWALGGFNIFNLESARAVIDAGEQVISDDCLRVIMREGRVLVVPAYPGVRLLDDACEKFASGTATTLVVGLSTAGGVGTAVTQVLSYVASALIDLVLFAASFRVLTAAQVTTRQVVPGAFVAAMAFPHANDSFENLARTIKLPQRKSAEGGRRRRR